MTHTPLMIRDYCNSYDAITRMVHIKIFHFLGITSRSETRPKRLISWGFVRYAHHSCDYIEMRKQFHGWLRVWKWNLGFTIFRY